MKLLFPALEARFVSDAALVLCCRKLYDGFAGVRAKGVLPYVEVRREGGSSSDTFAKTINVYNLAFNIFGHTQTPNKMRDRVEHFLRVFDDASLVSPRFTLSSIQRTGGPTGPTLIDGAFQAVINYEVITTRTVALPLVRGV